jgi:predicted transcriptional regulator
MLLSINPEHVESIILGVKRFEFRKVRCKSEIDKIIIYSTAPVKQIVAEAEVTNIFEGSPNDIWKLTSDYAGVSKSFFDKYYKGYKKAVAYELGRIKEYSKPKPLSAFGISNAPQSFVYI